MTDSKYIESGEGVVGGVTIRKDHALSDLELEAIGANSSLVQDPRDRGDDRGVVELERRKVDRDPHLIGPVHRFRERGLQYPLADLADQSGFLGQWHELVGGDRAAGRMGPAHQRFESRNLLAGGTDDRLISDA